MIIRAAGPYDVLTACGLNVDAFAPQRALSELAQDTTLFIDAFVCWALRRAVLAGQNNTRPPALAELSEGGITVA